jgi:hypothetical protein
MDFILGSNDKEKTTCLLHMANEYIIDNKINSNNGYILLFTPPLSESSNDSLKQKKNIYNFNQYFTDYKQNYKDNMNLIKCYTLNSAGKAYGIINNFRIISNENKGLKLILIDDITTLIRSWANDTINKQILKSKPDEKENIKSFNNVLFIYNGIFQQFLSKIISLQNCYQCNCFITIDINISEHLSFSQISPQIFNAIFPYTRNIFYLNKSNDKIICNELKLFLYARTNKIMYEILESDDENINDLFLKEKIEKLEKRSKQIKKFLTEEKYKNWMKKVLDDFVQNINNFNELKKQLEEKKKLNEEEDSSYTQLEK